MIENNSFGATAYFRPEFNHELMLNISSIYEYRRGGDRFEKAAYLAQQSEERMHNVLSGSIDYKYYFNDFKSTFSVFGGGQNTIRDHYTGIIPDDENSPEYFSHISEPPYGNTENHTLQGGAILNHPVSSNFGIFDITIGSEYVYDYINDEIIAYNYDIDQITKNAAFFTQINWTIFESLIFDIGLRVDDHNFVDNIVLNPRLALLYNLNDKMQIRGSFSTGFRAPQVFDTDLHIAFAGGGIQRVAISDDLQEENSQSYSFSINYDNPSEKMIYGFTVEGFYTQLIDAFILEENSVDGISILEKVNGGNSEVYGITTEARLNYAGDFQFEAGLSLQRSLYDNAVEWSEELPGTKEYLRTPDSYGYMTLIILPKRSINGSISAIYTGSMYIPHYGVADDLGTPENDILFESAPFFQLNAKASYQIPQNAIDSNISISLGVKNILDEYQTDFDTGKYRDSGYIYGPAIPRTLFFGISLN
jgi:outer membrane receptor for ferrienterochelin and colicins